MKVFILLGSDDYRGHEILDIYSSRELAEIDIKNEKHLLISRQGEPKREIVEKEIITHEIPFQRNGICSKHGSFVPFDFCRVCAE